MPCKQSFDCVTLSCQLESIDVLDMYEHAYHMDYGAAAAKYVDAFMQNMNWDEVNRRVETMRIAK